MRGNMRAVPIFSHIFHGYKWPTSLWLTFPETIRGMPNQWRQTQRRDWGLGDVTFYRDEESLLKFKRVLEERVLRPGDQIVVTFWGLFETFEKLELRIQKSPDGTSRGFGFGHLAASPGQIVIKSILATDIQTNAVTAKQPKE